MGRSLLERRARTLQKEKGAGSEMEVGGGVASGRECEQ